jgi:DNA-binding transcriptional MerR regulator
MRATATAETTSESSSTSNVRPANGPIDGAREMTIGEVAAEFGVSLRTLRFYEDRRLIRPRRDGMSRHYGGADRLRLQMILKGKQLGFTLAEISELLGTSEAAEDFEGKLQPAQIVTQIDHLERQRREIDEAITKLRATHDRLTLIAGGGGPQDVSRA